MKRTIMGVQFESCTPDEAVALGAALVEREGTDYVVTPNAEILYACRTQPELTEILNRASLVLPDGIGVVYASRILGCPVRQKVAGIDFGAGLLTLAAQRGWRVFFLGGKPGVAELAARRLCVQHPGLNIVGTADGYFKEDAPVLQSITAARPQLLFVCLGAPKQEYWMAKNAAATGASLLVGLGGSLDIYAGVSQRAPELWVRFGFEWAYRLVKEPWRIRRQLNLPKFLFTVIGMRLTGKR